MLLHQAKEHFEAQNDPLSHDYHRRREALREKDEIYSNYLLEIDAEIFACRASLEDEKSSLLENAKKLYEEVIANSVTTYLVNRARAQWELLNHD